MQRQCEVCGLHGNDFDPRFSRYVCSVCRQLAADREQMLVEQSRLRISLHALVHYGRLPDVLPAALWEPDVANARQALVEVVVPDPPSFRPAPPLFLRPPSPPDDCPCPSPPCLSPADELDADAVADFLDLPLGTPWPPCEALWLTPPPPPPPYELHDLCDVVWNFFLNSLDSEEEADALDFMP